MKKNWDIAINKPDYGKVSESCTWTLEGIFVRDNEIGIKLYQISVKSGYHLAQKNFQRLWQDGMLYWGIWESHLVKDLEAPFTKKKKKSKSLCGRHVRIYCQPMWIQWSEE